MDATRRRRKSLSARRWDGSAQSAEAYAMTRAYDTRSARLPTSILSFPFYSFAFHHPQTCHSPHLASTRRHVRPSGPISAYSMPAARRSFLAKCATACPNLTRLLASPGGREGGRARTETVGEPLDETSRPPRRAAPIVLPGAVQPTEWSSASRRERSRLGRQPVDQPNTGTRLPSV